MPLTQSQRDRLVAAAGEVERLLKAASIRVEVEPAGSIVARQCLDQYFAELARRFENGFEIGPAGGADPADMTPPKGWFVIARLDGRPVMLYLPGRELPVDASDGGAGGSG